MKNEGKKFEEDFKSSVPETCWIYRLRDNAASFSGGNQTRFSSTNICDFILFDDITRKLYLCELKSTKGSSIPYTMIKENQIDGLLSADKHNLISCFIFNFREKNNDTFFMYIQDFEKMKKELLKKSFNTSDLIQYNAIKIDYQKKRTRYKYDIEKMINDTDIFEKTSFSFIGLKS